MTTDLNSILAAYNDACEHLKNVTASELLAAFAEQFKANPSVKCMTWVQFTPYFNDGDPCTFSVSAENPCRSRFPNDGMDWTIVAGTAYPVDDSPYPEQEFEADFFDDYEYMDPLAESEPDQFTALESFLSSLPDDIMRRVFGDGVKVFVWEGGMMTEEYSHD